jgi:hypothetical protein
VLIKATGLYWNPDVIEWGRQGRGNKGRLKGTCSDPKGTFEADFWDATGVYVLYLEFRPVYVGLATARLGERLREHLSDRHAGRWDMFSWFSLSKPLRSGKGVSKVGTRQLGEKVLVETLEAVMIQAFQPPLNRKNNAVPDALDVKQQGDFYPKSVRSYLEDILNRLPEGQTLDRKTGWGG